MITNPNIQILANVMRELVDGQQPPPAGPKLEAIESAVRELHKHKSPAEFELLGWVLLGVLIERVGTGVKAQETLQRFIRGC